MSSYKVKVPMQKISSSQIKGMNKADLLKYTLELRRHCDSIEKQLQELDTLNSNKGELMLKLQRVIGLLEELGIKVILPGNPSSE